ncbi:MAG: four helix bundle protein [Rhizobiaceae bacterium]|nr:MAG: four helix bundle protein [Rhizobiaceae bacterium]
MDENSGQIRDYRDLIVWKEAVDIAELVYSLTRTFPREEAFGITSQMRRSAVSVPSNIAEGFGRAQKRSFVQFLRIAQGSLKELETQALLAARVGLLSAEQVASFMEQTERLGKRLVRYVRSLERSSPRS